MSLRAAALCRLAPAVRRAKVVQHSVRSISGYRKSVTGFSQGAHDDPIMWKMEYDDPTFDDSKMQSYRTINHYSSPLEKMSLTLLGGLFWFWIAYRMYWNYDHITGEFHPPSVYSFTDEELGIPPDDASDPEYWGDHHIHHPKNKWKVL